MSACAPGRAGEPELPRLLRIAVPLMAAYLAEFLMFVTTKMVVGRLGYHELAAVGLGGETSFEVLVVAMGLLSVVGVQIAQAEGAGDAHGAGHAARQGMLVGLLLSLPTTLLVWHLASLLALTGQDPVVIALSAPYLHGLAGSVLPILWFAVLRSFVAALGRTGVVMTISVVAVGLNYLLAVGLVHGRFGLPALGVAGAGVSTSIVSWLMLAALLVHVRVARELRGYGLFRARLRFDGPLCAELLRLGTPVAGLVLLESGLFAAVAILSGVLGAKTLAAYQVLMGWIGIPFMIALGIAEATMVRVAYGRGAGSMASARRSGAVGMSAGIVIVALLLVVPLGAPELVVRVFLSTRDPGFQDIAALVTGLLLVVALFQIFDALQAIAARALRGLRDTLMPLWIAGFGYWVLGIGGGSVLAFPLGHSVHGLWWGMAAGLIVTGTALAWRFALLTRRPRPASRSVATTPDCGAPRDRP